MYYAIVFLLYIDVSCYSLDHLVLKLLIIVFQFSLTRANITDTNIYLINLYYCSN